MSFWKDGAPLHLGRSSDGRLRQVRRGQLAFGARLLATMGVAALAAILAAGAAPEPRLAVAFAPAASPKDQGRLSDPPPVAPPAPWTALHPAATLPGEARLAGADPGATGALSTFEVRPPFAAPSEAGWHEREFATVSVVDGRTLAAGQVRVRLDGLLLPAADETCRTLDGRLEPCLARAATQLELLTRWRRVTCRYRLETSSEGVGHCRIGASDLADRLLRTGFARREGAART